MMAELRIPILDDITARSTSLTVLILLIVIAHCSAWITSVMIVILIYKMVETHQSAAGYPQNPLY
jgi:hypothetical protein